MSLLTAAQEVVNEFDARWEMELFPERFRCAAASADCVVALARAAPHLLMLARFPFDGEIPVVCEHAIDFLPSGYFGGKNVLLFDDTINFGSTMSEVKDRLQQLGASEVECFAVVVDENGFLGEPDESGASTITGPSPHVDRLGAKWCRKLSHREVHLFHNAEVRAFQTLGKPYNLDFPVFEIGLAPEIKQCGISALAHKLGDRRDSAFFHPFTTFQLENELYPISIPLRTSRLAAFVNDRSKAIAFQPHSKLRLYFDYDKLVLRYAAMIQVDTSEGIDSLTFHDPVSQQAWQDLRASISDSVKNDKNRSAIALHRAFVYAFSMSVARSAWNSIVAPALSSYLAAKSPKLSLIDASLLFGRRTAEKMTTLADSRLNESVELPGTAIGIKSTGCAVCESEVPLDSVTNPELCNQLLQYELQAGDPNTRWSVDPNATAVENLGSLLPYLRQVIDVERRTTDSSASRLRDGMTFNDLCALLSHGGNTCSVADLSFAIDVLVDGGMLVPQVVFHEASGVVTRNYRSGENDKADPTAQTKSIVHKLLEQRRADGDPPLSEKGFSKTFAILRLLYPRLPYALRLRTYGVEPVMDESVLRDWCRGHRIIQLSQDPEYK